MKTPSDTNSETANSETAMTRDHSSSERESHRASEQSTGSQNEDRLIALISPLLEPMGYEIAHLEILTHRQKMLRIFIDHINTESTAIGVQDCVNATKA